MSRSRDQDDSPGWGARCLSDPDRSRLPPIDGIGSADARVSEGLRPESIEPRPGAGDERMHSSHENRPILTLIDGNAQASFEEHPIEAARRALMAAARLGSETPEWQMRFRRVADALPSRGSLSPTRAAARSPASRL